MKQANALPENAIYYGHVMHCRLHPFRHRFVYRVFSLFADIDALDELAARTPLFSHNRFNLFSLMDKDHGLTDGSALHPWIEGLLHKNGVMLDGGHIYILCFPRLLGFVFNPLTVFFCFGRHNDLRGIVYEVRNTLGEKHAYVTATGGSATGGLITHRQSKEFYVSPFLPMNMEYTFRLRVPDEKLSVMIRQSAPEGEMLIATLTGRKRPFRTSTLLRALLAYPLMSLKVVAAIHFEALRLWRKGAKFVAHRGTVAQ